MTGDKDQEEHAILDFNQRKHIVNQNAAYILFNHNDAHEYVMAFKPPQY